MVVNVGIIGYRNHAQRLISLVETNSECKLKHIFHPNKKIDDFRGTNNFSDLLECDVIIISSPNLTHYEYLKKLKSFTGYIFCEKPPAVSLEDLNELKIIDDTRKRKTFFNFKYRFSELNQKFRKYLNP